MRSPQTGLLRLIDAAANRAGEGLRVVEDYVRFVLDDRHLTRLCKQLRHDLATAIGNIDLGQRLAARETQADVGTEISTTQETSRENLASVLAANIRRAIESLRSLEEASKRIDVELAASFEALRYRAYTLQRVVEMTAHSLRRLADARLYVLVDGHESEAAFETFVQAVIDGGADMIQIRDKRLDDQTLVQRARRLRTRTREAGVLMIVNDRPDLAVLADADGVHVGQQELSVKDARTIVGPDRMIGVSIHSLEQAKAAILDGANYLGVGPTFPSQTKQFDEFTGLDLLRSIAPEIRLPAFAIGGIGINNLAAVLETGFSRVAVCGSISAVTNTATNAVTDIAGQTKRLAELLFD